jgi:type IV pilus assembly protein PilM
LSLAKQYKDFMANFEKGELIGIDIGLSAVKVAILSIPKKGRYILENYHAVALSEAAIIEDEIQKPDEIIDAINECISEIGTKKRICNLGMDGPNTMTKRLQVPDGSKEDIEDNVLWESEQYISFGADESEIEYNVLGKIESDDVVDTVVVAAKTAVIEEYVEIIKSTGLIVKNVDLNIIAINNAFEVAVGDRLDELSEVGSIIIDFGAQKTTVMVYKDGGPILTKEIGVGGVLITEEIQRQMGVSYEEAEDLKTNGDANGNLPEEIVAIIQDQIDNQMAEIKKVLNFFIAVGSSEQVGACFVTGGSCRLPGLVETLQELVGLEVELLNPFDGFEYGKNISEDMLEDMQLKDWLLWA